jgi:GH15 family glucan-1,4-alpha-glucosidase
VIAGLRAAAQFTDAFGETETAEKYRAAAESMQEAVGTHLYDRGRGRFLTALIRNSDGSVTSETRLDASLFGLVLFGGFDPKDEKVAATMRALRETLWCRNAIGGMARYEGDGYQAVVEPPTAEVPGNPWIISTLWYAQYLIAAAKSERELAAAVPILSWVAERALPSGVLPEQVHPLTGEPWSVSPLTWSHAEFVITVQRYLTRLQDLTVSPTCGHPLFLKHPPGRA